MPAAARDPRLGCGGGKPLLPASPSLDLSSINYTLGRCTYGLLYPVCVTWPRFTLAQLNTLWSGLLFVWCIFEEGCFSFWRGYTQVFPPLWYCFRRDFLHYFLRWSTKGKLLKFSHFSSSSSSPSQSFSSSTNKLSIFKCVQTLHRLSYISITVASSFTWDDNFPHLREPLQRLLSVVLPPWMFGEGKQLGGER